jgi:hypothetical protein
MRSFLANLINCFASLRATWRYLLARRAKSKLVWQKTEHAYPGHEAIGDHLPAFADAIVNCGFVSRADLATAQQSMPPGADLGEYLFANGLISDEDFCSATSISTGIPTAHFDAAAVKRGVRCSLPAHLERNFGIVPVELRAGRLTIAGRQAPNPEALATIKSFTALAVDFQLTTRQNYAELQRLL